MLGHYVNSWYPSWRRSSSHSARYSGMNCPEQTCSPLLRSGPLSTADLFMAEVTVFGTGGSSRSMLLHLFSKAYRWQLLTYHHSPSHAVHPLSPMPVTPSTCQSVPFPTPPREEVWGPEKAQKARGGIQKSPQHFGKNHHLTCMQAVTHERIFFHNELFSLYFTG